MTTPLSESPADQTDAPNAPRSDAPNASNPQRLTIKICVLFYELEPGLFQDFIRGFQTDLLAKYPALPQPCPGSNAFVDAVALLLQNPEDLPPRMHEALLAI